MSESQKELFDKRVDKVDVVQPIDVALSLLSSQNTALTYLNSYYNSHEPAREALLRSIQTIYQTARAEAKVIITGVGKSGIISRNIAATFNSLGIPSCYIHPTEAFHGDLGAMRSRDTLMMITSSGRTPELLSLLPHLPRESPLIVLAACPPSSCCEILQVRPDSIFLPAPVHEPEAVSLGIPVPTTTAMNAHAVGNSLALAVSARLQLSCGRDTVEVFYKNHPGGAIGEAKRNLPSDQFRARL
ncbi:hypothetical protein CC78DRAFT_468776 [Lojkania enalia]|uniref:SIS domain-containing protein n=1 Tax=Lojkania enalia TaxID=147567 RepID=A0A9P4N1Z4_9PLEO|nr:hypothetical protein CC78DRAFT_468776 [Didymosphaeria enalia]